MCYNEELFDKFQNNLRGFCRCVVLMIEQNTSDRTIMDNMQGQIKLASLRLHDHNWQHLVQCHPCRF